MTENICHGLVPSVINPLQSLSARQRLLLSFPESLFFDIFSFCGFSFFRFDCLIRVVSLRSFFKGLIGSFVFIIEH